MRIDDGFKLAEVTMTIDQYKWGKLRAFPDYWLQGYMKECFPLLIGEHTNGAQGGKGDPVYENSSLSFISSPLLTSISFTYPSL